MEAAKGRRKGTFLVEDGYETRLSGGGRRALGREPRKSAEYARGAAASGVWAGIH